MSKPQQSETHEVKLCANCFPIVEKYQDIKEILKQLKKKGCAKCRLIAYAYAAGRFTR